MLNQKKLEIFLAKFHKSLVKQFLEITYTIRAKYNHGYLKKKQINTDVLKITK